LKGLALSIGLLIVIGLLRNVIPGAVYYILHLVADCLFVICGLCSAILILKNQLFGERELSLKNINRTKLMAVLLMLTAAVLFFGGIEIYGRQSDLARKALADVNRSQVAKDILGSPIRMGLVTSLEIRGVNGAIGGHLAIHVKGSMGSGLMVVSGIQHSGEWQVTELTVLCDKCQTETEIGH
jgi:hypothetical protein